MKIVINYDLLEEIFRAKHGFSLIKSAKLVTMVCTIIYGLDLVIKASQMPSIEFTKYLNNFPFQYLKSMGFLIPYDMALDRFLKPLRDSNTLYRLNNLSLKLKNLNINTTYGLLMKSYKYKTEYEVKSENGIIPHLVQKKYINIPVEGEKEEKVSILQEHVIGSRVYTLSKGYPIKQTKVNLAYNYS